MPYKFRKSTLFNASINIRNYALGIIDDRYKIKLDKSRVGITQSYACKDSSSGGIKIWLHT